MDITTAKEILFEALEGGYYKDPPEDDSELIKDAQFLYDEAVKMRNRGEVYDTHVKTILSLGDSSGVTSKASNKENLWIPPEIKGETVQMPSDITTLPDMQVRRLYSIFGAYVSRVKYLVSQEQSALANATHMREAAYRKAYRENFEFLSQTSGKPTNALCDSYAVQDTELIKWEERVSEHSDKLSTLKALSDIYSSNCDRLSRESTMRHNEWERSR